MNQVCHLFTKIKMLSLFSEKLPLKNLAYTHRKKVRKNACTLFYFKIKKKNNNTLYLLFCMYLKCQERKMNYNCKLLVGKKLEQIKEKSFFKSH